MGKKAQKRKNIKNTQRRNAENATQGESQPSTSSGATRSRKSAVSNPPDTSESDDNSTTNTSVSSRNQNHNEEISTAGKSSLVMDCVFYLLVADQRKYPIKKADIVKQVLKEHKKHYKTIMKEAELYLQKVMGIKLFELESPKGQFILVNVMKNGNNFAEISKDEKMKLGFTMAVLAIIFMSDDCVIESDMWKALKKIGVDAEVKHPIFGDIKRFLTHELVRQMYIEYRRENTDPPVFAFSWGLRAKLEVSKLEVLKFVCDIFGENMSPEEWPDQYRCATVTEETVEADS